MKHNIFTLASAIALAAALMSDAFAASAISLVELSKSIKPAIVKVVCKSSDGEIVTGTGFFVSPDGQLITSHHIVAGASDILVQTLNGAFFSGEEVQAFDEKHDIALLKVRAAQMPFLFLADAEGIVQGTPVAVFGNPLGLDGTLSDGIISAVRIVNGEQSLVQITAPISPGSSGSPVVNSEGMVVGVVTGTISEGQALNFAISSEAIRELEVH